MSGTYHQEITRPGRGGPGGGNISGAPLRMLAAIVWVCWLLQGASQPLAQTASAKRPAPDSGEPELRLIESLYREGDAYRAESEILRLLRFRPAHPLRPQVELARAKLFYREGRYREADLIVYSLLDRHPRSAAVAPAWRLLAFSQLRQGNPAEAQSLLKKLAPANQPPVSLGQLTQPLLEAVDPDAAEAWSTWLPGSGYLAIGQPGKAATAIALNLAFLGATAHYAREERPGAALLFLFFELMLWQGGRSGVRQDAEAINRRLQRRRIDAWLRRQGEPALLRYGIMPRFGIGIEARFGGGRPLSFLPYR